MEDKGRFFLREGMVIYNHSTESNAEEEDENWKMTTVLIMDITDDHCKSFFSRVMIAKPDWSVLKVKWKVRKWSFIFEELIV